MGKTILLFNSESLLKFATKPESFNEISIFEQCLKSPDLINLISLNDHLCL